MGSVLRFTGKLPMHEAFSVTYGVKKELLGLNDFLCVRVNI